MGVRVPPFAPTPFLERHSQQGLPMRQSFALILLLSVACSRASAPAARTPQPQVSQMQTIESVDPRPKVVDPPPMLSDEAPPPKPKVQPWETPTPIVLSPEDEKLRASLPFSPAIAM